jgi:hypothetical protein
MAGCAGCVMGKGRHGHHLSAPPHCSSACMQQQLYGEGEITLDWMIISPETLQRSMTQAKQYRLFRRLTGPQDKDRLQEQYQLLIMIEKAAFGAELINRNVVRKSGPGATAYDERILLEEWRMAPEGAWERFLGILLRPGYLSERLLVVLKESFYYSCENASCDYCAKSNENCLLFSVNEMLAALQPDQIGSNPTISDSTPSLLLDAGWKALCQPAHISFCQRVLGKAYTGVQDQDEATLLRLVGEGLPQGLEEAPVPGKAYCAQKTNPDGPKKEGYWCSACKRWLSKSPLSKASSYANR